MKSNDITTVESVVDLCRYSTGFQVLLMFLLVSGYSQTEISEMLNVSRQSINDELIQIRESYRIGKRLTYRQSKEQRRGKESP